MRDRVVAAGAVAWMLALQFYVAQVVVARAWTVPFSLSDNVISDLGNTACGPYPNPSSPIVCSPWHGAMNASLVMIGATMAIGAVLTRRAFGQSWAARLSAGLFVAAGAGAVMVGLYPENAEGPNHVIGAALNFVGGNLALVLFGAAWSARGSAGFRLFSVLCGLAGLAATILFVVRQDLGLGPGGIERVAAYTITTWQIIAGLVIWVKAHQVVPGGRTA